MSRRLTEDERAIWEKVARTTHRLMKSPPPGPDMRLTAVPDPGAAPPAQKVVRSSQSSGPPPRTTTVALHTVSAAPTLHDQLIAAPRRMDAGLHRRMSRGKLAPEARIDLHGMTRVQAQPALTRFLQSAHARNVRLVLVITGKGRSRDDDDLAVPNRTGALRHELPLWVRSPQLQPIVLELRPAHRAHGGEGAFYVYLRRGK